MQQYPLALAIDIGTSSTRTALFSSSGQRIVSTTAQTKYQLRQARDGAAEHAPKVILQSTTNCIQQTLAHYKADARLRSKKIAVVGTSCFWHSLIGTDEAGQPITNIYTWADSRSSPDAKQLRSEFSEHMIHKRTGCMLRSSFWPAKLCWIRRTNLHLYKTASRWMSPAEWLHTKWCKTSHCGIAMATGTGLFNSTTNDWDEELLAFCKIERKCLNPLTDQPMSTNKTIAKRWPELADTLWLPAIGDGAASNLGSGATEPGLAAINFGTSAAVRIMTSGKTAIAPFGLFCYRIDRNSHLVGGAISNAGNILQWCKRELLLTAFDKRKIERIMTSRSTPCDKLTILPFWVSERAPAWQEDLRGAIIGLTQATTALDILQATREAVFYQLARITEMIPRNRKLPLDFIVSGGIVSSKSDLQRLANILGSKLTVCSEPEASLRGAAVFALKHIGHRIAPLKRGREFSPNLKLVKEFANARKRQIQLEQLLSTMQPT